MNWLKLFAITALGFALSINAKSLKAQSISVDSLLVKALATNKLLPMLIDSAIKFSPELRRVAMNQVLAKANLQISKKQIYNAVSMLSSYSYGTYFSAVNTLTNPTLGNGFTTEQSGFYNVGVGIHLPLAAIISRKNIIKAGQSLVNIKIAEKENTALLIEQEVIRLYQDFKLSQKLMTIASKMKQFADINYGLAEKDFVHGQTNIESMTKVLEIVSRADMEFETYLNKFQTSYLQLEAYTGTNFTILLKQIK